MNTYINDIPFISNGDNTELNQPLNMLAEINCRGVNIPSSYKFQAKKANGSTIYSITDTGNDMTINNETGGFNALETSGFGKVLINNIDLDNSLQAVALLMAERNAELNREQIHFDENYGSSVI